MDKQETIPTRSEVERLIERARRRTRRTKRATCTFSAFVRVPPMTDNELVALYDNAVTEDKPLEKSK